MLFRSLNSQRGVRAFRFSHKWSPLPGTRFISSYLCIDSIKLCGARFAAFPFTADRTDGGAVFHKEKAPGLLLSRDQNIAIIFLTNNFEGKLFAPRAPYIFSGFQKFRFTGNKFNFKIHFHSLTFARAVVYFSHTFSHSEKQKVSPKRSV